MPDLLDDMPGRVHCTVSLTPSGNKLQRGKSWRARAARMKKLKRDYAIELLAHLKRAWRFWPPDRIRLVTFRRFGPRRLDDDNLKAGMKPLRDALHVVGCTLDDSDRYTIFEYVQGKGAPHRVDVTIRLLDDHCEVSEAKLRDWSQAVGRERPRG